MCCLRRDAGGACYGAVTIVDKALKASYDLTENITKKIKSCTIAVDNIASIM